MTLATYPSKRMYGVAAALGSTWGTPVAVGAGDELILSGDGNPTLKQSYELAERLNQVMAKDGALGPNEAVDFSPEFAEKVGLQYSPGRVGSMIAALFGAAASPAAVSATDAYKHVFTWADYADYFFTFCSGRPNGILEVPSAVPTKLSLKVGDGKVQGSITLRGNTVTFSSAVNTEAQMSAITPESTANFVIFQQGVLRMNAESGSALAAGDALVLSDFSLEFERTKDAKQVLGGSYIKQPKESAFKISGKFTVPHEMGAAAAWRTAFRAMTAQKLDLKFTGGVADDAVPYSILFGFPRIKFLNDPDVKLADIIDTGLEFVAEEAAAAPAGMTGYTRPYIELVNLRTTTYLA